jgi:hypothetical protein
LAASAVDAAAGLAQVGLDDVHRLLEAVAGTGLNEAGAGGDERQVARVGEGGVTGAVGLFVIGPPDGDLAALHHAPVRALAAVLGQPGE